MKTEKQYKTIEKKLSNCEIVALHDFFPLVLHDPKHADERNRVHHLLSFFQSRFGDMTTSMKNLVLLSNLFSVTKEHLLAAFLRLNGATGTDDPIEETEAFLMERDFCVDAIDAVILDMANDLSYKFMFVAMCIETLKDIGKKNPENIDWYLNPEDIPY